MSKGVGGSSSKSEDATALHAMEYSNKVMLMTAWTTITNPTTGKSWDGRVILDSACDSSFMVEDIARKLELNMEPLPVSNVGGFGGHSTKVQTKGVKFILGGVCVKAKTTKAICRPLTKQNFTKEEMSGFHHLKGLELADNQL